MPTNEFHKQYPDLIKDEANDKAAFTIAVWIRRLEQILALPPGHIWPTATEKMPAYVFADYLARMRARLGLGAYISVPPLRRWEELQQQPGLLALADVEANGYLPRSLAAKAVVVCLEFSDVNPVNVPFEDVKIDDPTWQDIMVLRHLGIVGGWHDGKHFFPERGVTYFECAKILAGSFTVKKLGLTASTKVFFAHSSVDKDFVRKLKANLSRRRVHGWIDEEQLPPGTPLRSALANAIADPAVLVIAVISKNSVGSRWVQEELELALDYAQPDKPKLIPLVIDDVEVPPLLRRLVYVPFRADAAESIVKNADFERAVESLMTAIEDIELQSALVRDVASGPASG